MTKYLPSRVHDADIAGEIICEDLNLSYLVLTEKELNRQRDCLVEYYAWKSLEQTPEFCPGCSAVISPGEWIDSKGNVRHVRKDLESDGT